MPNIIQNDTLKRILEKYDETKQLSSYIMLNQTIRGLRKLSQQYNGIDAVSSNEIFSILLRHQWNEEKETVADTCVARVLAKIFNANFDIEQNFPVALLRFIQIMARYSLLNSLEYAQANFTAITQGGGQYAESIAAALYRLKGAGLLTGKHAQANFTAITQGGGQYAKSIGVALGSLQRAGLLTGEHAQANFTAITQGGGQYAESIAAALDRLQWAGLLTGEHAQANFTAITQGGGQYAGSIAVALDRLQGAGLLTGEHAQANRDAITQGGGQYAGSIADALDCLQWAGLLTGEHAQANRDAITQGGGQYAESIAAALDRLQWAGLLTGEHAQKNVNLLFRYVRLSGNNYGIKFAVKCMKDLTQERFSLLMLDESVSIGKEQFVFFSDIFSFVVPEENMNYEQFDCWLLVKPMMHLHEYIHTYFTEEEQPEVLGYFIDMLESSYFAMDYSTELFSKLCQHFYHQGNHSSILFDENNLIKPMMLAILEMLAKSGNPEGSFSTEVCERINKELCAANKLSTYDIGSPSAEETKKEESEPQVTKQPLEEEFPVNERIVTLLYLSICRSPETFQTACAILKNLSVPPQLTRFSAAFNNASLFQRNNTEISGPLFNGVKQQSRRNN
jgi:hypothetical protein